MNKELDIWQFAVRKLKKNTPSMLLVVAESSGSSPGRQGFKMIVAKDDLAGSIGGGVMEVNLVEQAKFKIQNSKFKNDSEIVELTHQKNSLNSSGMICSGKQIVIFYQLDPTDLPTIRRVVRFLKNQKPSVLQISNGKFQISENRQIEFNYRFLLNGESDFLYEEKLGFKHKLFIIGGGHCALALSEIAAKMDFYITLFDDRPNLNTLEKNKFVQEKNIIESYEKIGDYISSGANVYVVVMTLGYKSDEIVIRALFDKKFKYFGVLGSRAKMKTLFVNLEKEGFPKRELAKIKTPIGLPINSQTPEEIAVSIAAQIIAVKNSKD